MKKIILIVQALFLFITLQAQTDPKLTEVWQPEPKIIQPGKTPQDAPSDAIVLFNGKDFSEWVKGNNEKPGWKLEEDAMTVQKNSGEIKTKRSFGDCQLHIEWRTPAVVAGEGQERGNSGIF